MEIRELPHPTKSESSAITAVLTEAFWQTPLFRDYLFPGRKALAHTFLKAMVRFSVVAGRVFVAQEQPAGIVACALWSLPDAPEMGLGTYLRTGLWHEMFSIALRSPAAMLRIAELFRFLDRYAPEIPCDALEFLASAQKGAGAALLTECIQRYAGHTLYVESIVSKNEHAFYRQFGFEPYERADFHGTDYAFALIQPSCEGGEAV